MSLELVIFDFLAWYEPGGGRNNQDPWRGRDGRGQSDLDDVIKKLQDRFGGMLGGGSGNDSGGYGLLGLIIAIALVIWFVAGLYRVEQAEEAGPTWPACTRPEPRRCRWATRCSARSARSTPP